MIIRFTTPDDIKGIIVVKEDGDVYRVFESKLLHKDSEELDESFAFLVQDLTGKNGCGINDLTYNVGDDRRLQAKITYDYITGNIKLTKTIGNTIEDYIEHYHYSLKEIRCNKCNSNLGYVEGDYSINCRSCGALNRR